VPVRLKDVRVERSRQFGDVYLALALWRGTEGLQRLQKDPADRGLQPGDAAEIAGFCKLTYDVTFPLFSKIEVPALPVA
jgi:hypothetical protein